MLPKEEILTLFKGAVEVEQQFWLEPFEDNLLGINAISMRKYVQFVADRLLSMLGCPKVLLPVLTVYILSRTIRLSLLGPFLREPFPIHGKHITGG